MVPDGGDGRLSARLDGGLLIVAATRLETAAVRLSAGGVRVLRGGIALRRLDGVGLPPVALSCGLAGALGSGLSRGDVVVPDFVEDEHGRRFDCDPDLTTGLRGAAAELGYRSFGGGLLTSGHLVVAAERGRAGAGRLCAVDMEAALLAARVPRFAAVKVVLDTPSDELSAEWGDPARALRSHGRWGEAARLALVAPVLAWRAGRVAAAARA